MESSFGSPSDFPGGRNAFHRHSQSGNHLGLGFPAMMHTQLPDGHCSSSIGDDATRLPNAATYESHDDLCLDQCMGVGLYNGSHYHRGGPSGLPARWPGRVTSSNHNLESLYDYSLHADIDTLQCRPGLVASHPNPYQQSWLGQQPGSDLAHRLPCGGDDDDDDDCNSSCCDSQCTMTGKCSNTACANKEDTCTDQNCPERPAVAVPSEVVDGAAALLLINHAPEHTNGDFAMQPTSELRWTPSLCAVSGSADGQGPGMGNFDFDLALPSQHGLLWSPTVDNVANHLLAAHGNPESSTCTRPCLLDDPRNYPNCPMPIYNNLDPFDNQYASVGPDLQLGHNLVLCGAEVHDPEAYLAHFNAQHRPFFAANAHSFSLGMGLMQDEIGAAPAAEDIASSPTTPLDIADSGASSHTASPLTPMSTSVDGPEVKPTGSSPGRSMSVASFEDAHLHRCLWREDASSDVCGQIFSSPEALFNHAASTHIRNATKGEQGFRCGWDDCPRSEAGAAGFPQRSKIERHMQTHIDRKFMAVACPDSRPKLTV